MIGSMLSAGLYGDMLSTDNMRPPTEEEPDITELFYSRLFKPIPKGKQITFTSSLLCAWQGTGKTENLKWDAFRCVKTYGSENVEIIYTNSYQTFLDKMTGTRPVVLGIIDDGLRNQNSRNSMSQDAVDLSKDYNETRHHFEEVSDGRISSANIIVETAVQRWHGLDVTFRSSAELIRFKSGETDLSDKKTIERLLGKRSSRSLDLLWSHIQLDNSYKNMSIGRIANLPTEKGSGIVRSEYLPDGFPEWPELARAGDPAPNVMPLKFNTVEDFIEHYKKLPEYKTSTEIYEQRLKGISRADVSKNYGLDPTTITYHFKKMSGLAKSEVKGGDTMR